jgi:hypothetical protein
MHEYSADGSRIGDYSPCASGFQFRRNGDARPGPDFDRLKLEVDRGQVWASQQVIAQLLPASRLMRAFNANGQLQKEVSIIAPSPGAGLDSQGVTSVSMAGDIAWNIFPAQNGRFLIEWRTPFSLRPSGPASRYLSLHDGTGAPAAYAGPLPSHFVPVASGGTGGVIFVTTLANGNIGFINMEPVAQ